MVSHPIQGRKHRVVFEDNLFRTAGAALLIEGDVQFWLESGAVRSVLIRRNRIEGAVLGAGAAIKHMVPGDMLVEPGQGMHP